MDDPKPCPGDAIWSDWILFEGTVATEEESLLTHLDHCKRCQEVVAALTDRDPFHRESRLALQSTGLSSQDWNIDATKPVAGVDLPESNSGMVSLVKSLTGPTDDERSIGRLGRFEVLGIIGSGGMGIVLKARSIDMDRIVAIKIPQPHYWQSREMLLTLDREARSAAAVVHPNVISIYHVDRYRDVPYLVMPYFPGQTLQQRINASGALTLEESMRVLRQVATALAAAHACGVIHRDVKPANILLGAGTDRAVLTDFGLAKVQSDVTCTATGTFAGTPIYLSPEQASGLGAGPAGDVFSLGTVLWTMLAGTPPLAGMHAHAIVRQIAESKLPTIRDSRNDLPDWVHRLIQLTHAPVPADRPTAKQLVQWSEACQRHLVDQRQETLPAELRVMARRPRRTRWIATVAGTMTAGLIGLSFLINTLVNVPSDSERPERGIAQSQEQSAAEPDERSVVQANSPSSSAGVSGPQAFNENQTLTPTDEPTTERPEDSELVSAETVFLQQLQSELDNINRITIPDLEQRIDQIAPETP